MDKYDKAIEHILSQQRPGFAAAILWNLPSLEHGCLFQYCSPSGDKLGTVDGYCGCITMVRRGQFGYTVAGRPDLAEAIRQDERIPVFGNSEYISNMSREELVAFLEVCREWQRRLDVEIRGVKPTPVIRVLATPQEAGYVTTSSEEYRDVGATETGDARLQPTGS
jgi:hypothetical protein